MTAGCQCRNKKWCCFLYVCVIAAFVSIRACLASCWFSVFFPLSERWFLVWLHQQQSNNPSKDLFTGIIILAVMHPGTSETIIPTKSSVWGVCLCYCLSQGIICYHCGYYGFHSVFSDMCTAVWELFSETEVTQRQKMKKIKPRGWICLLSVILFIF